MAGSGFASKFNFRKHMSERSKKSKYAPVIRLAEDIEAEEKAKAEEEANKMEVVEPEADDLEDDKSEEQAPEYTLDDVMNGMDKQMRL